MIRLTGLILVLLITMTSRLVAAEPNESEKEVRTLVQRYFAAYAAKDLEGFMALWSDKAPDYKSRKETMQRIFAETEAIELKDLTIVQAEAKGEAARLRVRVELAGKDKHSGKPHPDLGKLNRVLILKKEDKVWKVWRYVPAEQEMLERLLAAKDSRQKLYEDDKDLLTRQLVGTINGACLRATAARRFDEAVRVNELAFEVLDLCPDKSILPYCYLCRAQIAYERPRYREALADIERALALAREMKNRKAEALTLRFFGDVYQNMGRFADARRSYQDSLKIYRELGDRVQEADVLLSLGVICRSLRRYDEAALAYQDSLKVARALKDRSREASALLNLGVVYADTHRNDEALRAYEDCLTIARARGDRQTEGRALNNIGNVYRSTGRYAEALPVYQNGLKIVRELGKRKEEANILNGIGIVYTHTGRYEEALRVYQDSLKIERELGYRKEEIDTLGNLGALYNYLGRYNDGLRQHQDCLKLARALGDRSWEAGALGNMAITYDQMGRYNEALRHVQDSLKIIRELGDRAKESKALHGMGYIHVHTSRYADALRCFQDSLKIARELGNRAGESATLSGFGDVYRETGLYAEALRCYQDVLKIDRDLGNHNGESIALEGIGLVYRHMGRYADALRYYQDSLQIKRRLGDRAGEAGSLHNIGVAYRNTGRYEEALRVYQDSLKIERELGDRAGEANTLNSLGNVYRSMGRYREALTNYAAGLELAESIGVATTAFRCHWGVGDVHRDQKHWQEAVVAYRRAIAYIEQIRSDAREQSFQTSFLAEHIWPYRSLIVCLRGLGRPNEAFAFAERTKARALMDVLQAGKADVRKGMTAEERRQEQQLQERFTALTIELENLRSHKLNPERQAELARELDRARQDGEAFRRQLYLRLPDLQARRGEFTPASLTELNRVLFADHPKLMVLSYLVADKETVLFVLTCGDKPDGPVRLAVHCIEVGEKELSEAVEQFRAACRNPHGGTPDGSELYRWLLAPVEDTLAQTQQVLIVPDGPLHTLPFQALKDGEDGKYLIERCPVSYAPSLTALLKMAELGKRRREGTAAGLLAAGIGDFGRRERNLPNAEPEAQAIAQLFGPQALTLLGRDATRTGLRAAWADRRYLHLATHGRLNENVPLYSAVVLERAGEREEGLLFARDLLDEDLSAELVVLSACETGLGRRTNGEGLLGMTWAWFVAGVPSTIASQWSVADASTARLMQVFYTELKDGASKAEALRRAQLALLKERKTRHPFFWAPFVLNGDAW